MPRKKKAEDERIRQILEEEIPFLFLSTDERNTLLPKLKKARLQAGTSVFEQGDSGDQVFLLVEGLVETVDPSIEPPARINRITAGRYFGERSSLFDQPRDFSVRVVDEALLYALEGEEFLKILHTSRSFAQSFGSILREKQGIFDAFDAFLAFLHQGVQAGGLDLRKLIPLYLQLEPALHQGANAGDIDFAALKYAVTRLPENITRNFVYLLTDDIPYEYSEPDSRFISVPTDARRRNIWEMLPGKSLVLLRNGLSDLADFITCLCLYAVEARKLRKMIDDPDKLLTIDRYLDEMVTGDPRELGRSISLSKDEVEGLITVWGNDMPVRLRQIAFHREAVNIDIRRQTQSYNSRRTDIWTHQIGDATRQLLGYEPSDLPEEIGVHIISSNTHSVTKCLNPLLTEYTSSIKDWAEETRHPAVSGEWSNEQDLVYAVSDDYMIAHPDFAAERPLESDWGILRLRETVSTGIEVQLVDLQKLIGQSLDVRIGQPPEGTRALIINIDYAFGEQAEEIIRNLILLFGKRLKSINILGKAGALVGKRGDILMPTAFVEQNADRFYPFSDCVVCEYPGLEERVPRSEVHCGRLLTVTGTLLQNRQMLHFYKHIWGCIGLEMEGTCYYRQILESQQLEVIPSDIRIRFLYYVSDMPLLRTENLASRLTAAEGIPPLYGITRQIIRDIFEQESKER